MSFPDFMEIRFPEHISYGSKGGPKFKTTLFEADSGYEQANRNWSKHRCEYDVSHGIKTREEMDEIRAFFYVCNGMAGRFRYKDWADFQAVNQNIGVGNGSATQFQMTKTYSVSSYTYVRPLKKLVSANFGTVLVNAAPVTPASIDYNTGIITLSSAPANGHVVSVTYCEFDVPVRFNTDQLDAEHDFWQHESWSSIPIVEVRV
jgi:uncharacterized protein (TIGR02217 family)